MSSYSCTLAHYQAHLRIQKEWADDKLRPHYNEFYEAYWKKLESLFHYRCQGQCLTNPPPLDKEY